MTVETKKILSTVPGLIDNTFPLPGRFRASLSTQVAELSRLLTGSRGDRSLTYLSRPNFLSAYLHYFLPWNLYRLCCLLPSLEIDLKEGDIITDLGSGPLTFVSALWIARPELRALNLEFYCIDHSAPALEAGRNFFTALSKNGNTDIQTWNINLVREDIRPFIRKGANTAEKKRKSASLLCAVNIFNELYEKIPHSSIMELKQMAVNIASYMRILVSEKGRILTVEPGIPQSGRFISFLREAFIELGYSPVSPCQHTKECPLIKKRTNNKKQWCHFAFDTVQAPKELHSLSSAARIPKDRIVLSYLLTVKNEQTVFNSENRLRIISDMFPLPNNKYGRYCCSLMGLVLLTGERIRMEKIASGHIFTGFIFTKERDKKSGAIIAALT